ncbi:MAG: hypothetical protein L3J37_00425 [Rhodobacteraceae bacterium]|nr:hypothetical protein [Paracoccaceae bacterium]
MSIISKETLVTASALFLSGTDISAEPQWRLGVNIGSYHIESTGEFKEFNPGAFISVTYGDENRLQYGFQFGGYSNSYGNRTTYALGFVNYRIKKYEGAELLIGGFSGLFEYANLVSYAESAGIPTVGDMVYIAGPTLTYRLENGIDLTLGYIPFRGKQTNGILTLQTSILWGGAGY